jgi:hypothetical protein
MNTTSKPNLEARVFDSDGNVQACPLCGAEITITRRYREGDETITVFRCERHGEGREAPATLRPPGFHLVRWRGAQLPWVMWNNARPWNVPPLRIKELQKYHEGYSW